MIGSTLDWRIAMTDEVLLLDAAGEVVLLVDRPTHPGAGLGVEIKDEIRA